MKTWTLYFRLNILATASPLTGVFFIHVHLQLLGLQMLYVAFIEARAAVSLQTLFTVIDPVTNCGYCQIVITCKSLQGIMCQSRVRVKKRLECIPLLVSKLCSQAFRGKICGRNNVVT